MILLRRLFSFAFRQEQIAHESQAAAEHPLVVTDAWGTVRN
jgi:hypothetical protein